MLTAREFAALADAQVGKPYVLGAEAKISDPNPPKFDCSELVEWLFGRNGTPITDLAAAQYDATKPVSGAIRPGDLVFLRNNPARANGIGHVAVITAKLSNGDWRIVEARGRAAGTVRTTLSYWRTRKYFAGVRRFPAFKLAAEPTTPVPAPGKATSFWATTYNGLDPRFGGKIDDDAAVLKKASASVYLLTETPERVRNAIRARLAGGPSRWKVWERGSQAILFDSTKWAYSTMRQVTFGPTSYHGAVIAVLTRKDTGQRVQFAALHLPPRSVAGEAARRVALGKLVAALDASLPTVIGGDFNSEAAPGWLRTHGFTPTITAATTDHGKRYDYVAVRRAELTAAEVHNPGAASDHRAVRAKVEIGAISPN